MTALFRLQKINVIRGWTHLKTDHAGQNHSPRLQFCPLSKEARTQGARAATVTTKTAERKKTKKTKKRKEKKLSLIHI